MRVEDLRSISLFDGLSDDQLAELLAAGTEISIEPGIALWHEGEHADYWWVLVNGAIELARHIGREDTVVGKMTCRAAGPAVSAPGTSTASTSRPAGESSPGGCSGCRPRH